MKRLYLSSLLIFLFLSFSFAQEKLPASEEIPLKFREYLQHSPHEKAYIHLDKTVYSPGEDIWFKAYMTDPSTHKPASLSTILYVELLDPHQNLLATRNILIVEGIGIGDFKLEDSLKSGDYLIRAYTRHMQNFDPRFFFSKKISLISNEEEGATDQTEYAIHSAGQPTEDQPELRLSFFPEGGEMIKGLQSRVAIKAEDSKGKGVEVSGVIINFHGDTISWINTHKFGLGDFTMLPQSAEMPYSALVNYQNKEYTFKLPDSRDKGFSLNVQNHNQKIYLKALNTNPGEIEGAFILGHIRGVIFSTVNGMKGNEQIYISIPTENIPSGIAHFTLFDKHGIPQAERLVFVDNPMKQATLSINSDKPDYASREQASFQLTLQDHLEKALTGRVSVTAVSKDLLKTFESAGNIKSYFLLSSDLKGKIEDPAYYFTKSHKDRHYLLDLLMLTHGWRRFSWNDVLNKPLKPLKFKAEDGFTIKGQLFDHYNHNRTLAGTVNLMFLEDPLMHIRDTTGEDGRFSLQGLHFMDTATLILQARKLGKQGKKNSDAVFITVDSIKNPAPETATAFLASNEPPVLNEPFLNEYRQKSKRISTLDSIYNPDKGALLLKEVEVKAKKDRQDDPFYRPGQLHKRPSDRLILDSIPSSATAMDLFDVIHGRVTGVRVFHTENGMDKTAIIRGAGSALNDNTPLFMLDGVPVDNATFNAIPPQSIAYVDVLKGVASTVIYGGRGGNGVIAAYSKKYMGQTVEKDTRGIIHIKHPGYYRAREFYTPNYQEEDPGHSKPDYRSTLYWNPDILISEGGTADFSFFTSDEKAEYIMLIEGITEDGRFITGEKEFRTH